MTLQRWLGIGLYNEAGAGGGGEGNAGDAGGSGGGNQGDGGAAGGRDGGKGAAGDGGQGGGGATAGSGAGGGAPQNPYEPSDWRHGVFPAFAADEKAVKYLAKFKDLAAAIKAGVEMEGFQGNSVRIPKDDAKPEDWAAFYAKLGRPNSPAEYKFERPQLPQGIQLAAGLEESILQTAYEAGLNGKQVEAFFKTAARMAVDQAERARVSRQSAEAALNKEWGMEYGKRLALAKKAAAFLGEDFVSLLASTKLADGTILGNHPGIVKALYGLGLSSQEAGWIVAEVDGISTPEAAKAEVEKLMKHPAYLDKTKPEHKEIVEKVNKLQQLRFGTAKAALG